LTKADLADNHRRTQAKRAQSKRQAASARNNAGLSRSDQARRSAPPPVRSNQAGVGAKAVTVVNLDRRTPSKVAPKKSATRKGRS
jgi:hypothetical protein